jgi:hypothetical protein
MIFLTSVGLLLWLKYDNSRREKIDIDAVLAGKSELEIQEMDYHHPAWRWQL